MVHMVYIPPDFYRNDSITVVSAVIRVVLVCQLYRNSQSYGCAPALRALLGGALAKSFIKSN